MGNWVFHEWFMAIVAIVCSSPWFLSFVILCNFVTSVRPMN